MFTMREAAAVAGVSVSTLRRRRTELTAAGSVISAAGWQVPITALIAVGLLPGEGEHPNRVQGSAATPTASSAHSALEQEAVVQQLQEQVRELTEQVSEWRRRAEVAEARAEERGRSLESLRAANETERMALRMLTGTIPPPIQTAVETPAATAAPQHPAESHSGSSPQPAASPPAQRRGGFFRRLFTD